MTAGHSESAEPLSLRSRLRTATAALHERVDSHLGQILQQTDDGYAKFLATTAGALLPLERALDEANVSEILPDWPQRSRSDALRLDLAELRISAPDPSDAKRDLRLEGEAHQFGVLYVLEGSRLGAHMILRNMKKGGPQTFPHPTRYLSHGEGQPLWQTFLKQLEASRAAEDYPEMAIAGATVAFEMFLPR